MEDAVLNYFFENFKLFFLVFIRITSLYFVAPFFGETEFPKLARLALAFFTALIVFPLVGHSLHLTSDATAIGYGINVINQIIIGVLIGLISKLFFSIIQLSGQYFTIQIGFGMINTMDPLSQTQISILGTFQGIIGSLTFFLIGGHHFLIYSIVKSISFFPLYTTNLMAFTNEVLLVAVTKMFYLGFMFGMPIIGSILIFSTIMGLLAKISPQMNLLMIGFPIKILLGLIILMFLQGLLMEVTKDIFYYSFDFINQFINVARQHA